MPENALRQLESWRSRRKVMGFLLVALDFDGTIAPIVKEPFAAQMLPSARAAIDALLQRGDTLVAFVSGRSLKDLLPRCGFSDAYYVGNHGLEIRGPLLEMLHPDAVGYVPALHRFGTRLRSSLAQVPAVQLEDKELSLSVHYRKVEDEAEQARVVALVEAMYKELNSEDIQLTYGKRVVEIRPNIAWNKGDALIFLQEQLSMRYGAKVPVVFIGDDQTDEDGFTALPDGGTVVVANEPRETAARGFVSTIEDVVQLLEGLA